MKNVTPTLTWLARILVGALFIFSGLIKLNDPVGFSFKLEEYFGEDVLNLPFLAPMALGIAVVVVIYEIVLGVLTLIGQWKRFTLISLTGMMVFFTFLTFYSAYFNKVTDCGCFGDAIPLTPWQSFYKDVILLALIAMLWIGRKSLKSITPWRATNLIVAITIAASAMFAEHVLNHLPVWDFRAYKPGTEVLESLKSAEELGLEGPQYETYYTMVGPDAQQEEVSGTAYIEQKWYNKEGWVMDEDATFTKQIRDGYEPPIHDFSIELLGQDVTDSVLQVAEQYWLVAYEFSSTDEAALDRLAMELQMLADDGMSIIGMTSSSSEAIEAMQQRSGTNFPWAMIDGTALKTILRSNPGVTHLKNGIIVQHFHHNDFPPLH